MKKNEVVKILASYGLAPSKKLGQNFLLDETTADRIVSAASVSAGDAVLEIGPGLGVLTERLLDAAGSLTAVEIDAGMVRYLRGRFRDDGRLTVVHMDFLKYDLPRRYDKIISNLPYYCGSEILFRIAEHSPGAGVCVLMQKEMARRVEAKPGVKEYGALSVTLGLYFRPRLLFTVDPRCFYPRPEVMSALVSLEPVSDLQLEGKERELFHRVVKSAFWGRRKTLLTALAEAPHLNIKRDSAALALSAMGLDAKIRGENLGVREFVDLTLRLSRESHEQHKP